MTEITFSELMEGVRRGEHDAAETLIRLYEPQIRRMVRVRLTSPAMRRQMDSMDICQSVLGDFFVRAALGQYELETPAQLIALLTTMARNRVVHHVRRQQAARRDVRRVAAASVDEMALAGDGETPSQIIAGRELVAACLERLSEEERYLADQRAEGRTWAELGEELGELPDTLRKRLERALDRVSRELGLEEEHGPQAEFG